MGVVAGSYDMCMFNFLETGKLSSRVSIQCVFPLAVNENSRCAISLPAPAIVNIFHSSHPKECIVVYIIVLICIS